jgi:hypothetical protein
MLIVAAGPSAHGLPVHSQKQALLQLKQAVESRVTYAEEARQAGVVPVLTRLLGLTGEAEGDMPILCLRAPPRRRRDQSRAHAQDTHADSA